MDKREQYMPLGVATSTLDVLNPSRSVIIDMIMVQMISAILTMLMVLIFKGNEIGSTNASYLIVGLFLSFVTLTGIFARINK